MALDTSSIRKMSLRSLTTASAVIVGLSAFLIYNVAQGNGNNDAGGLGVAILFYPLAIAAPVVACICIVRAWLKLHDGSKSKESLWPWLALLLLNLLSSAGLVAMFVILSNLSNQNPG